MAGDWIAMRTDLADDPAVIQIAAALGLDEHAVIGRLHRLWAWADQQTTNGVVTLACAKRDASSVTDVQHERNAVVMLAWIDRYVGAQGFAAAMVEVGWLAAAAGEIRFPNFDRWNSQTAKRRLLGAKREARRRANMRDASVTQACAKRDAASATEASPTGEERRGDKEECVTPPTPSPAKARRKPRAKAPPPVGQHPESVPVPPGLQDVAFLALWGDWIAVRADRGEPLTERAARIWLKQLADAGLAAAVAALERAVAGNWKNLYFDTPCKATQQRTNRPPFRPGGVAGAIDQGLQNVLEGLRDE